MNKILVLIILLTLIIGCKKNFVEGKANNEDITRINNSNNISLSTNEINNKNIDKSVVISCGSGCAMTYNIDSIIRNNSSSIKVKFKVDMYVDEQLSDTYYKTFIFLYDKSNQIEKIHLEGKNENILKTLSPDAQEAFKGLGNELIRNTYTEKYLNNKTTFLYDKKNDPKTAKYQIIETSSIKGLEKYSCGEQKMRYLPLPNKSDIKLFLAPQDCGDFEYRYYLLTIKNNIVIDNLYVEGEWQEPESKENKEYTSFKINTNSNIEVTTKINNNNIQKTLYEIDTSGTIKEL